MTIKSIKVQHVRGISTLSINDEIKKNKPNIVVAPNGFGKTSFATAFKCAANQTSIKIEDPDRYKHENTNQALLEIQVDFGLGVENYSVSETAHSNKIRKKFDIWVISDLRKIKATSQNFGNFSSKPKGKMVVDPIEICDKVRRATLPIKLKDVQNAFGNNSNLIEKYDSTFQQNIIFTRRSIEFLPFLDTLLNTKKWGKIETIRKKINLLSGTPESIIESIISEAEILLNECEEFKKTVALLKTIFKISSGVAYIRLWHLLYLRKNKSIEFEAFLRWNRYTHYKSNLESALQGFNSTSWKKTILKETNGKLVANFPEPAHVSNGQRDVVVLTCMLFSARINLTKENAILIIDEVFDYLDDANLTAAQFYISQIIQDYQDQKKTIYPIILTHLNPNFFRNYVFSNQNIIYLENSNHYDSTSALKKLISSRKKGDVPDDLKKLISKYLVHYHIDTYDFKDQLSCISGTRSSWGKSGCFQSFLQDEFNKYKNGEAYDPLAICAITRRRIEEKAYSQIATKPNNKEFFNTHTTAPKLDFAVDNGAVVPESHYLLRIIFDDGLHWDISRDNTIPIVAKLSNPIIKKMIEDAVE